MPPADVVRHDGDDPYLWWWRRQGHGDLLRHANAVAPNTASGWATPSPPAARWATTTRRWASPRARRLGVGQAPLPRIGVTSRRPIHRGGIGDMSGDVFGNGMLLSRHIRLVPPRPPPSSSTPTDPARVVRRARAPVQPAALVRLGRLRPRLISAGGGICSAQRQVDPAVARGPRHASRPSPANADPDRVDPRHPEGAGRPALQRRHRHLRQATRQPPTEVGDRANDAVRVNGGELRCKVVGEGGNLALPSPDASNSRRGAGASTPTPSTTRRASTCSDHEVNIKILLGG